jgi:hypothetical protein
MLQCFSVVAWQTCPTRRSYFPCIIAAAWNWQFEAMAEGPTLFGAVAKPAKRAPGLIRWERHACLAARMRLIKRGVSAR